MIKISLTQEEYNSFWENTDDNFKFIDVLHLQIHYYQCVNWCWPLNNVRQEVWDGSFRKIA